MTTRSSLPLLAIAISCSAVIPAFGQKTTVAATFAPAIEEPWLASSAGGVSKGAYQAGVDWTIVEYMRRQRREAFRVKVVPRELRERFKLHATPTLKLWAATGASAGNVNALFAALAWCTGSLRDAKTSSVSQDMSPQQSLYWKAWIHTGIAQLLVERPEEDAAFDRTFMKEYLKEAVGTYLDNAEPIGECDVPVGLTLTKLDPTPIPLAKIPVPIRVQRFASVFTTRVVPPTPTKQHGWIDFARLHPRLEAEKALGALALPVISGADQTTRGERLDAVFDVVLASSAFPGAFAPVRLCYEPGGLVSAPQDDGRDCAPFIDGGVFDNNPIGLAAQLFEGSSGHADAKLAYTSPVVLSRRLADARRRSLGKTDTDGLSAIARLATGAFASARDYELQSFLRQDAREPWRVDIRPSSRSADIVGESMGSFGAFLGRPFREYDFYLGVYDGLRFVASEFICRRDDKDCASAVTENLIKQGEAFQWTPLEATVLTWHLDDDGTLTRRSPVSLSKDDPEAADRLTLLKAIHGIMSARRTTPAPDQRCEGEPDVISRLICPGGLGTLLDHLNADPGVRGAAERLRRICENTPGAEARGECVVDEAFAALLAHPRRTVYRYVKQAAENIERVERRRKANRDPNYATLVQAVFSLYKTSALKYSRGWNGFHFNWSSGRTESDAKLATVVGELAPNYVSRLVVNDKPDLTSLGWRLVSYTVNENVHLNTTGELVLRDLAWKTREQLVGYGVSVGSYSLPVPRFSSLELGVFRMAPLTASAVGSKKLWVARATGRLAAEKLQVSLSANDEVVTLDVGVSDVNGILYWLLR